jgi:uncharacterized protein YpmS
MAWWRALPFVLLALPALLLAGVLFLCLLLALWS